MTSSKFNVQSIHKKPIVFDDGQSFDLRACIKAPPGYKFLIFDLSQIEARITPYLAGDWDTIEAVRGGMSIYEVHARKTMGWTGGILKKEDSKKYALAKARVLALGFQCSANKFQIMAATEKYGSLILDLTTCKKCVNSFRAQKFIPDLWKRLQNDLQASVGEDLVIQLPSGRELVYYDVIIKSKVFGGGSKDKPTPSTSLKQKSRPGYQARTTISGRHKFIYGGLLTENLVQATARDVFGEAIVRLEDAGYDTLFTVHDEGTLLVPESWNDCVKVVEQIVGITPDWLPDCPIGCEVAESYVYEK